ncbi:MAG TPA: hypothetical protein VJO35_08960 [Terriglobales bacterium]|nr:hypothetical protein [Terriglobales bacterium]
MRASEMVLLLALAGGIALGQTTGNRESRSGSPTGMRGGLTERPRSTSAMKVFRKTAPLVHLAPDELARQYSSDSDVCAVAPKSYVALRMAEQQLSLDRRSTLTDMCDKKTQSFAEALSKTGKATNMGISPRTGSESLYARERDYMQEIDNAIKKKK